MPCFNHFKKLDLSIDFDASLLDGVICRVTVPRSNVETVLKLTERVHPPTHLVLKKLIKHCTAWHITLESTIYHSKFYSHGRVFSPLAQIDKQLRYLLFNGQLIEIDIANFVPQTLSQIAKRAGISCPKLQHFVANRTAVYQDIKEHQIKKLRIDSDPKQWMIKMLNGYHIPAKAGIPQYYHLMKAEVVKMDAVIDAVNLHIELNPDKIRKPQTARSRWVDTLEIHIQELCLEYLQTRNAIIRNEFIPIHDGMLINKSERITDQMLQGLSHYVFLETGFSYTFKIKQLKQKLNSRFYHNCK